MIHCMKDNPFRTASWRWHRAAGIVDGSQPSATRLRDGAKGRKTIRDAVAFKQEYDRRTAEADKCELASKHPAIFWSHALWHDDLNPMKWQVEAHILARGDDFEIGFECGIAPEIVETYENLFFDVREKLMHPGYIKHSVMGPAVQRGLSEREYDLLWKMYGYWLGPHALAAVSSKFVDPVWCATPDAAGLALQDDAISTLKLKAALAAKTVNVNSHTQLEIIHAFTKYVEVERMTDSGGRAQEQIMGHIGAMFESLPFGVAGRDPREDHVIMSEGPISPFDTAGIELTYEETMRVSVGQRLPNSTEMKALAFPEVVVEAGGST